VPVYISLNYNISHKFSTATGIDIGKNMAGTYLEPAFAPDKGTPQAKLVEPGSAHSVDLTADGLDFGTRPANCINDMMLASRASSRSNFLVLYCHCRLAVACAVGFEIVFCLPTS
jgi:hypothetical protein